MKLFWDEKSGTKELLSAVGLGFFCSTADGKITTNRKFQLKNLTFERVLKTFEQNLRDFFRLLEISKELGCGIFRLGSNFIPFASHPAFRKEWLAPIEEVIREVSPKVREFQIRITMHPGQFVVLNSPKKEVVEASLRELEYHFWLLECLGVGKEGVVVIHGGGIFGDKRESLSRLKGIIKGHSWLIERLALENDETHYTVSDLLPLAELGVPIVFDYYHHKLNPSEFTISDVINSWQGRVPEFHLSSFPDRKHRRGEHGDWIDLADFMDLLHLFQGHRFDLIIEAKMKEKAVQKLREELGELT